MRAEVNVSGIIQGVGFRPFIYRIASQNSLVGSVRNRGDGYVEIVVEGTEENVRHFLKDLVKKKPPLARIEERVTTISQEKRKFDKFTIVKSSKEAKFSGSVIPPDLSICGKCLNELRNEKNKRHDYFFITCTNCGPRYSIVERLPYDRENTTMQDFEMCDFCLGEYSCQSNRRFHAQTVACSRCGPKAYLTTTKGEMIDHKDPIREAGRLLEEGNIIAIKGYGGFHIATATVQSEPIARLRRVKNRSQKPFAIMARDLEFVRSFAEVQPKEAELLTSYRKPIVLLMKSDSYYLSDLIVPGLHNVGVMLPYTGLHEMLFDDVYEPAFVMTSANSPSEPIVTMNFDAMRRLGSIVDFFLFHNRNIAQRCDDSVVRVHGKNQIFIRRSRGYAPEPIRLVLSSKKRFLGLGAELNVTACVLSQNKAFISQHIGNVENLGTFSFLKDTVNYLIQLTTIKPNVIVCDLHPKFTTTGLAYDLGKELKCPVLRVQHHYAHIASLMGEHDSSEMLGIICDGYGYGSDGGAWGGEIIYSDGQSFERLAHLQEQPMVGADLAARYPLRMVAGILRGNLDVENWLFSNSSRFPHGETEVDIIIKQLKSGSTPKTTSCGRILDAVSAILGICYERTYEGEPAMKLESAAMNGKEVLVLEPKLEGNTLDTLTLVHELFYNRFNYPSADLAFSAQSYLAKGLAQLAMREAEKLGVVTIGFSGGVAYNGGITLTIKKTFEKHGFKFCTNNLVPPGDGGISFGQVVAANLAMS